MKGSCGGLTSDLEVNISQYIIFGTSKVMFGSTVCCKLGLTEKPTGRPSN